MRFGAGWIFLPSLWKSGSWPDDLDFLLYEPAMMKGFCGRFSLVSLLTNNDEHGDSVGFDPLYSWKPRLSTPCSNSENQEPVKAVPFTLCLDGYMVASYNQGTPSYHPFLDGIFPEINRPFWGTLHLWKPPYPYYWRHPRNSWHWGTTLH